MVNFLFFSAIFFLIFSFFFPFWRIVLIGRPYNNIGVDLYLNKIDSLNNFDIDTINTLNHYVGMKPINFLEFLLELKFIFFLFIFIFIFLILNYFLKSNFISFICIYLYIFFFFSCFSFLINFSEFFGKIINKDAVLYVNNFNYSFPYIGCKKILNMISNSFPGTSSLFIFISFIFVCTYFLFFYNLKKKKK